MPPNPFEGSGQRDLWPGPGLDGWVRFKKLLNVALVVSKTGQMEEQGRGGNLRQPQKPPLSGRARGSAPCEAGCHSWCSSLTRCMPAAIF